MTAARAGRMDTEDAADPELTPADGAEGGGACVSLGRLSLAVLVLLCGVTMFLGYENKARCIGPAYDEWGRSTEFVAAKYRDACYSDIQHLWIGRDIDRHVFPYVHGGMDPDGNLVGGSVEYPVLTGLLIWAGALFVDTDAGFLLGSALLLAPFGLLTAWLLGRLSRWRALIWALGPPLVLYAFHNWELAVVACAVAAVYVVHRGWGRAGADRPLRTRGVAAAVLLGLGFAFKIYPAIFVLPLMFYVATGGPGGAQLAAGRVRDVAGAVWVALAALGTAVLVNLPFAITGYAGWWASFVFQGQRKADITANSIWFWAFRPESDPDNSGFHDVIAVASPLSMLIAFAIACAFGWVRYQREGSYPWVAVSAAMLCGFLLLHKAHSPQYALWLVPMFVLMRVHWGWIVAYFVADIAMGLSIFFWYDDIASGAPSGMYDSFTAQAVLIGVWGRAALLAGLFVAFLRGRSTVDPTGDVAEPVRPAGAPA